ncbi:MAG: hypothetical protein ACTSQE_11575 [Candidatus Heimdallarchaeaceae archaeon]
MTKENSLVEKIGHTIIKAFKKTVDKIHGYIANNIKSSVREKGSLPTGLLIITGGSVWLTLFIICSVTLPFHLIWLRIFLPVVGSYTFIGLANGVTKKLVGHEKKEEKEELITHVEVQAAQDIEKIDGNVIIRSESRPFAIFLVQANKRNITLIPIYAVSILSLPENSENLISNETLNRISANYRFTIMDTSKYEILIFNFEKQITNKRKLTETLARVERTYFADVKAIVDEIRRENRAEFSPLSDEQLIEIFPTYARVLSLNKNKQDEVPILHDSEKDNSESLFNLEYLDDEEELAIEIEKEMKEEEEFKQKAGSLDVLEEFEVPTELIDEQEIELEGIGEEEIEEIDEKTIYEFSPEELQKIEEKKEFLLNELNYSFDNFLSFAKCFYKSTIERQIGEKFEDADASKFMKIVLLFCEKEKLELFYPTYNQLLKFEEFKEIEIPSSTEIENFIDELIKECFYVKLDEKVKSKLKAFLNKKLSNSGKRKEVLNGKKVDYKSIPRPSVREIQAVLSEGD